MPSKEEKIMRKTMLFSGSSLAMVCLAPWLASAQPAPNNTGNPGAQPQAQAQGQGQGQGQGGKPSAGQRAGASDKPGQQAQGQRQVAETCMRDLTAFSERMDKEGYWLSGYRQGFGWNTPGRLGMDGARTTMAPANTPAGTATTSGTNNRGAAASGTGASAAAAGTGPWGNMTWRTAPAQEIGTLYRAAAVLAHRGDEQACQTVLGEVRDVYGEYAGQLREAGVEPGQMVSYRQQQLAAAQPVTKMQRNFRADNITGMDVRNPQDEYLGSVEDVILNPGNGQISYVILSRGGFLGLGEDYVALPWQQLRATPQMDAFVVRVTEDTLDKAPKVNPDSFANAQADTQRRQEIDRFWQQQTQGG